MMLANTSVWIEVKSPRGSGHARVRAITASIFCSIRQLMAAAAPATRAIPSVPKTTELSGGSVGAARNMPITAVNTISTTTPVFVSARNRRTRSGRSRAVATREADERR